MRRAFRSVLVTFVAILAAIGLTVGSAFAAALAFGAVALIVPGTGTHNIGTVTGYKENAANRYIDPSGVNCTSTDGCNLVGIDYPASFFPLVIIPGWCPGLSCDTWNQSVGTGVTNLNAELAAQVAGTPATEPIIIFGYSQGGAVVSRAMYDIDPTIKDRVSVVTIGNINNPLGLWSRLGFLPTIPFLDISFGPQLPTDIGVKSTNYSFEYDPVGDAPQYWGNPLTMLNALAAFQYVHGYYLVPNSNDPAPAGKLPYGYDATSLDAAIQAAPKRAYNDATFVLIPQKGPLPIFQPFIDLGKATGTSGLIDPLVALLNPVTKLLVDLGYDRITNPGIARNLSILPFNPFTLNPIEFAVKFVAAIFQGIRDAINVIVNPASTAVAPTIDSTLVARSSVQRTSTDTDTATDTDPNGKTNVVALDDKGGSDADARAQGFDEQGAVDQSAIDKAAADKEAADRAAAEQAAAEQAAAEQAAADKAAADKTAADQAAAEKVAADNQAADKGAADKAAADKAAADKAATDKAATDKAATDKDAADKAAADKAAAKAKRAAAKAKAALDKEAAQQAAADKAKEAADKARETAAANIGVDKKDGAGVDENATDNGNEGTGESEKKAA
jgi:hypothetical protein